MTEYLIKDDYEQVLMSLVVDWQHPDTADGIREMSMFWAGHPGVGADVQEHFSFLAGVIADRAYGLSREDKLGFNPDNIHELVFDSEGFCGSDKPWIKLYDFVDDTTSLCWEVTKLPPEQNP